MNSRHLIFGTLLLLLLGGAAAHAAGPVHWDWRGADGFRHVRLEGAALDEGGALVAGLVASPAGPSGPEVLWCLVDDGAGGYYTGSGHGGLIHHTGSDGVATEVVQVPASEVFSLAVPRVGGLLAGCGPEGQLYRISEDGAALELGKVPGGYIWDLLVDGDGETVWLATGSPAAVWKLQPDGELVQHAELEAQNVLDLAFDGAGNLLAATQGPGLVYRLSTAAAAEPRVVFEADQNEVRQLLTGPDGVVHALALQVEEQQAQPMEETPAGLLKVLNGHQAPEVPRSAIYRLEEDGLVSPVWTGDQDVMIAAWSERWGWLAGTVQEAEGARARLLGLVPPAATRQVAGWEGGDVLALLVDDQRIVAALAHSGAVRELAEGGGSHHALSRPVDAGRAVRWGRLRWQGRGATNKVRWAARVGNRSEPDATWTDWSDDWSDTDRALDMPAARYLQWRATLPRDAGATITGVSVSAWRRNMPPSISGFREEVVADMQDGSLMARNENVTQTMRSGLRVEFGKASRRDRRTTPERSDSIRPVRILSWRGEDQDGDRLAWTLAYRRAGETAWRKVLEGSPEIVASWDTSDLPDGDYDLLLTATDAPDNPAAEALSTSRKLGPLTVDNTAPRLGGLKLERTAEGIRVRLRAEDEGGVLGSALVVFPDHGRERLDPVDGICDSAREDFDLVVPWPRPERLAGQEPWRLRVEVRDLAGNLSAVEGDVR